MLFALIRLSIEISAHYAAALGLLLYLYPWSTYAAFDFPRAVTVVSYLLAAAMITAVCFGLLLVSETLLSRHGRSEKLTVGCLAMIVVLAVLSIGIGTGSWDMPGSRLHGIFFAEWQFLTFFFKACLPLCALAVALEYGRVLSPSRQS